LSQETLQAVCRVGVPVNVRKSYGQTERYREEREIYSARHDKTPETGRKQAPIPNTGAPVEMWLRRYG